MRDLKPLNADTYDTTNTVYARNDAFQQQQQRRLNGSTAVNQETVLTAIPASLSGGPPSEEYQFVWDAASSANASTVAGGDVPQMCGHSENRPDLVKIVSKSSSANNVVIAGPPGCPVVGGSMTMDRAAPRKQPGSYATEPRTQQQQQPYCSSCSAANSPVEHQAAGGAATMAIRQSPPPPLPAKMRDLVRERDARDRDLISPSESLKSSNTPSQQQIIF